MKPSRLFLWLAFAAVLFALLAVISPWLSVQWALMPFGILVVALFVDWLLGLRQGKIAVDADYKPEVFVGEYAELNLTLSAPHLPAQLTGVLSLCEGFQSTDSFQIKDGRISLKLMAKRRGIWPLETLWLRWRSRIGLLNYSPKFDLDTTFQIVPNIRPMTSGQIDLELQSADFGAKQTAWRGEGSEFHQLNDYIAGMDPRSIDWKRSARANSLVAKEMRAERNHQIIMAIDNGHLMREEIAGLPKIDHKINSALALSWAALQSGDMVGMFAFDARPRLFLPALAGQSAFPVLRNRMAELEYQSVETNHTFALSHLHQRLSKRSLIVIFSDFVDPLTAELLVEHLAILNRHHVVIFVSLHDPVLTELANGSSKSMNDVARSVSAATMLEERQSVLDQMAALGIYVIEAKPGEVTPRLLNTYLGIRSREVI